MVIGWLTFGLSALAVIFIPTLVLVYRGMLNWTRVQSDLKVMVRDIQILVKDKDRAHEEIVRMQREDRAVSDQAHREINAMQREDRAATDRRLRWLEERLFNGRTRDNRDNNAA